MASFTPPAGYARIKKVTSFHSLVHTPFADGVNALCWERSLPGDFAEVIRQLDTAEGITTIEDSQLELLTISPEGKRAVAVLLEDQRLLRSLDLDPVLDCINGSVRDTTNRPVTTDIYSFHADSATIQADTYLCTYHGATSEGLRNDEAQRRVDIPETRTLLLELYGGKDDAGFQDYLNDNCFDLHYAPLPHAQPFAFGLGNLWRIAVDYPGSPVPPCIHRAPHTTRSDSPRLLLIS